jgi:transcriptional regulator GlxA family with amidase domain
MSSRLETLPNRLARWTMPGKGVKLGQMAEDLELRVVLEGKTLVFRYPAKLFPLAGRVREALAGLPLTAGLDRPAADARIARTLAALHGRFSERWTLAKMAKVAGMSRAAFVARFKQVTGMSPGAYLTRLRLDAARELLIVTDDPAAKIALRVGYDSPYAFSRAFKRLVGRPPIVYRRNMRAAPARIECKLAA